MSTTVELYVSRALGVGLIAGTMFWLVGVTLGYFLFVTGLIEVGTILGMPVGNEQIIAVIELLKVPGLVVVMGVVFGSIGFAIGFGTLVSIPYARASSRKREINLLLTDAVSFMYALSVGGLNQLEILEAMAEAEDTYGAVSQEFQTIVNETEYFDIDYRTAIQHQSLETPSGELSQFLTDMLSVMNSGGSMESFLKEKKEKHMRTAKQEQELSLETLELFGEMYMTLSLFPLLLIIILVIMQMVPDTDVGDHMLYLTIYAVIPLVGVGFIVMISTVKYDEPGDGYLSASSADNRINHARERGLLNLGLVEQFTGEHRIFDRIKDREGTYDTIGVLTRPHHFFRDNPLMTLALTVPASLVIVTSAMASGSAPTTWSGMVDNPVWGTFIYLYLPAYLTMIPLVIFWEWNVYRRKQVVGTLSEDLRKLSSANETGLTLLESLNNVSDTTTGKLSSEFEVMHTKVDYGMNLKEALIEFNNKFHIPRLARTVKLIAKAQEASDQISEVLRTAAQSSENHDDLERDRRSRTRMQVVIIIMTFLTLLAVIAILQTQFIATVSGIGGGSETAGAQATGGGPASEADLTESVDTDALSLLFFHAITFQAILSGFIAGYIRDAGLMSGLKFVLVLISIALGTWIVVT